MKMDLEYCPYMTKKNICNLKNCYVFFLHADLQFYFRPKHNSARDFLNTSPMAASRLPPPSTCTRCNARLFYHESCDMCCSGGKISLEQVDVPPELLEIFSDSSAEGRHFRQHIRSYNHVLSFTSMGVHIDEDVAATGRGIYSFRAQGAIYHKIGGFYPTEGSRPRFLQMYIYDTEHELHNRMLENPQLQQNIVQKLQQILHGCNPYVHALRQLAQRPDVHDCSLLIKERPANQPRYNMPTASQVATIVVGEDAVSISTKRDIIVMSHVGNLINVKETMGYYDPLQYPLLFPYGTFGWDRETTNDEGQPITCLEYYSYMLQVHNVISTIF